MDNISSLAESFAKNVIEPSDVPFGATLICIINFHNYNHSGEIIWQNDFSLEKRLSIRNEISELKNYFTLDKNIGEADEISAVLELIRTQLKCQVFLIGYPNSLIYIRQHRLLLGICGKIGAGKSTVSDYIREKYKFTEYQMAGPLKQIAVILGFNKKNVYGTQKQKAEIDGFWGTSARTFLQVAGTDLFRDTLSNKIPEMKFCWIRLFEKYHKENADTDICVSDVRFADEADFIKKSNGFIIKIIRNDEKQSEMEKQSERKKGSESEKRNETEKQNEKQSVTEKDNHMSNFTLHASEKGVNEVKNTITIINDSTLDKLYEKIDTVMKNIINGQFTNELEYTV